MSIFKNLQGLDFCLSNSQTFKDIKALWEPWYVHVVCVCQIIRRLTSPEQGEVVQAAPWGEEGPHSHQHHDDKDRGEASRIEGV